MPQQLRRNMKKPTKKLTIASIRKLQYQIHSDCCSLIQQTMKEKNMGVKDAYELCKKNYAAKYGSSFPTPY